MLRPRMTILGMCAVFASMICHGLHAQPNQVAAVAASHATLKQLRMALEVQRMQVCPYLSPGNPRVVRLNQQIQAVEVLETPSQVWADQRAVVKCLRHELSKAQQRLILDRAYLTEKNPQVVRLQSEVSYLHSRIGQLSVASLSAA